MYANVLFPLKLPPLTYRIPDGMPIDIEGFIVKAPLGRQGAYGVVTEVLGSAPEGLQGLRELDECRGLYAGRSYLSLIRWLSQYYLTAEGLALKACFFDDFIKSAVAEPKRKRRGPRPDACLPCMELPAASGRLAGLMSEISSKLSTNKYSTSLVTLARTSEDARLVSDLFEMQQDMRNVIIAVPEIDRMNRILGCLSAKFGSRVCGLHSRLTPAKRADAVKRILSGESDIVVGTRSAVLAPMQSVSLIIVNQEQSRSYKAQEGLRYNARDVAVMRGYISKSPVILTSVAPSLESVSNCATGKYTFIGSSGRDVSSFDFPDRSGRPVIRIARLTKKSREQSCFSSDTIKKAKDVMKAKEAMLFLINRKGYSLIRCDDCGSTLDCKRCGVPLVFHKAGSAAKCSLCGAEEKAAVSCPECSGFNLAPSGIGLERVKEEIDSICSTRAVVLQKPAGRKKNPDDDIKPDEDEQESEVAAFCVGTAHAVRRIDEGFLNTAVFVSAESMLSMPDFRARERALQEIMQSVELVKPGGTVIIQSYRPDDRFLKAVRSYDLRSFYADELAERMALGYPPYSNIILFSIDAASGSREIERTVDEIATEVCDEYKRGITFYGPVQVASGRGSRMQFFMKARDSVRLHKAAESAVRRLELIKNLRFTVDVDPLKI